MKYLYLSAALALTAFGPLQAAEISNADLAHLPFADIVVLGEVHDNGLHHLGQAQAISAIRPKAVVFEMLTAEQAASITPELLMDQQALATTLAWDQTGWPDFALYYPVFAALGGAQVYGAARPRDQVRRSFSKGAAVVFGPGYGLDQPLPKAQLEQRKQEQFEAHCEAMPIDMMGGMVEAQRFRDAGFADVVVQAFGETGGPVVLIAGNGHARKDWAVPFMLDNAVPDASVLVVSFLERPVEGDQPYDLWLLTDPAQREDPCLAFQK